LTDLRIYNLQIEMGRLNAEVQRRREKNLSPGPSPQGRGVVPKGRILQIRTMVVAAEAELPLSPWRGGRGERFGEEKKTLCVSALKKLKIEN
jgi:hypothetical protein